MGCRNVPFIGRRRFSDYRILVERYEILVLQDFNVVLCEVDKVSSNQQRRFHDGPERKMATTFLDRQIAIPNLKHVWVVVAPEIVP